MNLPFKTYRSSVKTCPCCGQDVVKYVAEILEENGAWYYKTNEDWTKDKTDAKLFDTPGEAMAVYNHLK